MTVSWVTLWDCLTNTLCGPVHLHIQAEEELGQISVGTESLQSLLLVLTQRLMLAPGRLLSGNAAGSHPEAPLSAYIQMWPNCTPYFPPPFWMLYGLVLCRSCTCRQGNSELDWSCPLVSRERCFPVLTHCFWPVRPFHPLFCHDPWALGQEVGYGDAI